MGGWRVDEHASQSDWQPCQATSLGGPFGCLPCSSFSLCPPLPFFPDPSCGTNDALTFCGPASGCCKVVGRGRRSGEGGCGRE